MGFLKLASTHIFLWFITVTYIEFCENQIADYRA